MNQVQTGGGSIGGGSISGGSISGGSIPSSSHIGQEAKVMISYFLLLFFAMLIVYIPRVPDVWFQRFRNPLWQFSAIVILFGVTELYGWVHGILAALAFALLLSNANMTQTVPSSPAPVGAPYEPFDDYIVETNLGQKAKRWFVEKVLGENPYLIRENAITTTAVQDLSGRNSGSSTCSSPSSK